MCSVACLVLVKWSTRLLRQETRLEWCDCGGWRMQGLRACELASEHKLMRRSRSCAALLVLRSAVQRWQGGSCWEKRSRRVQQTRMKTGKKAGRVGRCGSGWC